jgi:hypothetical protein
MLHYNIENVPGACGEKETRWFLCDSKHIWRGGYNNSYISPLCLDTCVVAVM